MLGRRYAAAFLLLLASAQAANDLDQPAAIQDLINSSSVLKLALSEFLLSNRRYPESWDELAFDFDEVPPQVSLDPLLENVVIDVADMLGLRHGSIVIRSEPQFDQGVVHFHCQNNLPDKTQDSLPESCRRSPD